MCLYSTVYHQGSMLHSVHYGKGELGRRDSSICCYRDRTLERYGVIQKFCLCPSLPAVVLVWPFDVSSTSLLKSIGNSGRYFKYLCQHWSFECLFHFCFKGIITCYCCTCLPDSLCVQVYCNDLSVDYIVKIPNNYEHHWIFSFVTITSVYPTTV